MFSKFLVYGLADPETGEIRYIGRSSSGLHRPKDHATPGHLRAEGSTHKTNWIKALLRHGLSPEIKVLRECFSIEETFDVERDLIALYRAKGARLTNQSDGGAGSVGCVRSEEFKLNLSKARKGVPRPEWVKQRIEEGKRVTGVSEKQLAHIREVGAAWKGQARSAETRAKMAAAKKAWWAEHREEQTARLREAGVVRRGRPVSPETKAKMSVAKKGIPKSPETRARMSEGKRLSWARRKAAAAAEAKGE